MVRTLRKEAIMAISIRNVEKFLKDHPEFFDNEDEILEAAKKAANKNGVMSGAAVNGFMGRFTDMFFFEVTRNQEHINMGLEDLNRSVNDRPDIPKDKNYPEDSVQCGGCGGAGIKRIGNILGGCVVCAGRGWLTPKNHPDGRKCEREACSKPLPPNHIAVYCKNECAHLDA